jgi:hypothetical protein
LLIATASHRGYAQIPNPGFESWTAGNPDSWLTDNTFLYAPVTQTSNAHSGSSAVAGTALTFDLFVVRPIISAGTNGTGFPVSSRQAALHGWYKFVPVGGNILVISVVMAKGGKGIGAGGVTVATAQNTFSEFVANIFYATADVPDTCYITISITGSGNQPGSVFVIDDLAFGAATTSVEAAGNVVPAVYELSQNYPNPFNPSTTIRYAIPQRSHVTLSVFNALGQDVATLVNESQEAGFHDVKFEGTNLASGVYLYRIQAGSFIQTKKLLLLR